MHEMMKIMPGWLPFNFKWWTAPLILNMSTHRHTTESAEFTNLRYVVPCCIHTLIKNADSPRRVPSHRVAKWKSKNMYILLFWNNDFDQKVKNKHLFFSLVFAKIRQKRTRAKDQKQTIYFKRPYWMTGDYKTCIGIATMQGAPDGIFQKSLIYQKIHCSVQYMEKFHIYWTLFSESVPLCRIFTILVLSLPFTRKLNSSCYILKVHYGASIWLHCSSKTNQ